MLYIGCSRDSGLKENFKDTLPVMADEPKNNYEKPNKIGIYVDTTPSMQGFLGMQEQFYKDIVNETVYAACLDEIDNLISSSYDVDNIEYYRVDTPLWRTEENVLRMARTFSYYDDHFYTDDKEENYEMIDLIKYDGVRYESYCLANALLNCVQDDFSVIVTDFYENEVASSEVTAALKKNMSFSADADRTIGIVGMKSEFAGQIYDLPGEAHPISYGIIDSAGTAEDIVYRQFFVLVIGEPNEVSTFCNSLQKRMGLEAGKCVSEVFYEDELYGLDYQDYEECFSRSDGLNNYFMPGKEMSINDKKNSKQYIYIYKNIKEMSREIIVSYKVNTESFKKRFQKEEPVKVSLSVPDPCEKELIEIPFVVENSKVSVWDSEKGFVVSEGYEGMFQIQHIYYSPQENHVYVVFQIINEKTLTGGIKFYGKISECSNGKEELCSWVDAWNFYKQKPSYEKTWRLKDYVIAIENEMPERNLGLIEFAFYIYLDS